MAEAIDAHGCVLDCFATERKHSRVKEIAVAMRNTARVEQAVIARVVLSHLDRLRSSWLRDGLKCPQDASDLGLGWSVSKCMQWWRFDIGTGDAFIVHDGRRLVMVHACLQRNGAFFVVAKLGSRLGQNVQHCTGTACRKHILCSRGGR